MNILSLDNVSVSFGGIKAVNGMSFEVRQNEVFTIIGPNGAGKTTIFNLLSRLYDASTGTIMFGGEDVTRLPAHKMASKGIARTFQNLELFDNATVLRNILVGAHAHRRSNLWQDLAFTSHVRKHEEAMRLYAEEIIDFLELQAYRNAIIKNLPYGVRKIVEIARALCSRPKLLLLDEPSSGLNLEETRDLAFWIEDIQKDLGITVLMIEHDMGLVGAVSDRVLAVNAGMPLVVGTPKEVQTHPEVIQAYLGEAA